MDIDALWSIRLGFTAKQSEGIKTMGVQNFLKASMASNIDERLPEFLNEGPKSLAEFKAYRQKFKAASSEDRKKEQKKQRLNGLNLQAWWVTKMQAAPYPLREKMVCFWHNHYVSTLQKVKVPYWIYQHHMVLQQHAFGNFKELTKAVVKTNAMVKYLDNNKNRNNNVNENLSRELLELFTLGIGNYTEQDIKNGGKALAGLGYGNDSAHYRKPLQNNNRVTYFGKTGHFKVDDMIDIIFEQPSIPYLITRKIVQWFIDDHPEESLVHYYGDYFREVDFEIAPLLLKIFKEEYAKDNSAGKVKDPLTFILQLLHELQLENTNALPIVFFLKQQGMDLFNQPNVKGWEGGNAWLTSQTFLQRNKVADLLCMGLGFDKRSGKVRKMGGMAATNRFHPKVGINRNAKNNLDVIHELTQRMVCMVDPYMETDMEHILRYDFDPQSTGAENGILRLFNYIAKTPEFQVI